MSAAASYYNTFIIVGSYLYTSYFCAFYFGLVSFAKHMKNNLNVSSLQILPNGEEARICLWNGKVRDIPLKNIELKKIRPSFIHVGLLIESRWA